MIDSAEGAAVTMWRGGELYVVAAGGTIADHVGQLVPLEASLAGAAVGAREPMCANHAADDPRVGSRIRADPRTRSLLVTPLFRGAEAIGALAIVSARRGAFGGDDVAAVREVGDFIATTLASFIDTAAEARRVVDRLGDADHVTEFVANVMRPGAVAELRARMRVTRAVAQARVRTVVQPIVDLQTRALAGVEALSRFSDQPYRPPDAWFREAHEVGLGVELEALAVRSALENIDGLPAGVTLGINVSRDMLVSGTLPGLLAGCDGDRLFLELTEHLAFDDYGAVRDALAPLRERGVRLAIDDLGAGFSSFRHVVELSPDTIKLDRFFTAEIEAGTARGAMAKAIIDFAGEMGMALVAEGIETERELETLRELGVRLGQGYLLARPSDVSVMATRFAHLPPAPGTLDPGRRLAASR